MVINYYLSVDIIANLEKYLNPKPSSAGLFEYFLCMRRLTSYAHNNKMYGQTKGTIEMTTFIHNVKTELEINGRLHIAETWNVIASLKFYLYVRC